MPGPNVTFINCNVKTRGLASLHYNLMHKQNHHNENFLLNVYPIPPDILNEYILMPRSLTE